MRRHQSHRSIFSPSTILALLGIVGLVCQLSSNSTPKIVEVRQEARALTPILKEVREMSEMTTISFYSEVAAPAEYSEKLLGLIDQNAKMLLTVPIMVRAGADMSQATLAGNVLQLPPVQILEPIVGVTKVEVYDYQKDFFLKDVSPDLQKQAQIEARARAIKSACDGKILEKAQTQAYQYFSRLLKPQGIEVQTSSIGECRDPAAPQEQANEKSNETSK